MKNVLDLFKITMIPFVSKSEKIIKNFITWLFKTFGIFETGVMSCKQCHVQFDYNTFSEDTHFEITTELVTNTSNFTPRSHYFVGFATVLAAWF